MEVFDGKKTSQVGLWWHPEFMSYQSPSISLATLRKFKGNVRFYFKKNPYKNGKENRPGYLFSIVSSKADGDDLKIEEVEEKERLYTYSDIEQIFYNIMVAFNDNDLYDGDDVSRYMYGI